MKIDFYGSYNYADYNKIAHKNISLNGINCHVLIGDDVRYSTAMYEACMDTTVELLWSNLQENILNDFIRYSTQYLEYHK